MAFLGGWDYKLSKQRIKSNTHAEGILYFIFQKEAIFAGADTLKLKLSTKRVVTYMLSQFALSVNCCLLNLGSWTMLSQAQQTVKKRKRYH